MYKTMLSFITIIILFMTTQASGKQSNAVMVPEKFLRSWDPVTIFFPKDTGQSGPEDRAGRFVSMLPEHPGAYTWLDARTLQFRPAEPWPPLMRFKFKILGRTLELDTLMPAPIKTSPARDSSYPEALESISLTFPKQLPPKVLAQILSIEIRPLPGAAGQDTRILDHRAFDIKTHEQHNQSATYSLLLHRPIPPGFKVTIRIRLALDDQLTQAAHLITFTTAEPFRVTHFGAASQTYPVTPTGVSYTRREAIRCPADNRTVKIYFSADIANPGGLLGRSLVHFTPAVEKLKFETAGTNLLITGGFQPERLYLLRLEPTALQDTRGRKLAMTNPSQVYLYFPAWENYLKWKKGHGIIERDGPQMVPMSGRGHGRVDIRIHRINSLDRSFWPFPHQPLQIDEEKRPPGPGEEPAAFINSTRYIRDHELQYQIRALGSPQISTIVDIPLRNKTAADFGLDLKELLKDETGTYLVGMRKLDHSSIRSWMCVQVTNLSLTSVEEPGQVNFAVTSLSSGLPVAGARIRVEGYHRDHSEKWTEIFSGTTGPDGLFRYKASGHTRFVVRRILVSKGSDILTLNPNRAPQKFYHNHFSKHYGTWLQWTQNSLSQRAEPERLYCHLFTERPVYRLKEPVHLKGYVRNRNQGKFTLFAGKGVLVINGPGEHQWRYPLTINAGGFYHKFNENKLSAGEYQAVFEYQDKHYGEVTFKKEAYRIPRFEILLHGPGQAPLDQEFKIALTARYYAGGRVADQPVRWRVTQFPYTWSPAKQKGYYYSSDLRFSGLQRFQSTPVITEYDDTDEQGGAILKINPVNESNTQPRRFVIEAVVTGADDQTVSNTCQVIGLPGFTLGLKLERYVKDLHTVTPEIIVTDPQGKLLAGHEVTIQLLQRQWHSHLIADDFSRNAPKYQTEAVDQQVFETKLLSTTEPCKINLPIENTGVYLVKLIARDKVGRSQSISVDFFAGGHQPVTWSRPPARTFKVTPTQKQYKPGETAELVLESPFQNARVLAVVEPPDEPGIYQWLSVKNGQAVFKFTLKKEYMPQIPLHFILMRGRLKTKIKSTGIDLAKPATLVATAWVHVLPLEHEIQVKLKHPELAQPGDEIKVAVLLSDHSGEPLAGEVVLWLVDHAVLSLGREQALDPLPAFISTRSSHISIHDTRNLTLGYLPLQEHPGGDIGVEGRDLLDKVTIRKNFKPLAYYNPAIKVGPEGQALVSIKLPDNLTVFKVRAKAVSAADRFGFAKGSLRVRLPVIVQPSLPRFIRPGDRFTLTALARIVEGPAGPGRASLKVQGLELDGPALQEFTWIDNIPQKLLYNAVMPASAQNKSIKITLGVERVADKVRDGFEVELPVQADRKAIKQGEILTFNSKKPLVLPGIKASRRAGTFQRRILIANHPALVRMAAGLDYLMDYPHGCTEQRISQSLGRLAFLKLGQTFFRPGPQLEDSIQKTLEWLKDNMDDNNLISYWPGSSGSVSLTAWTVSFMTAARDQGFKIDEDLFSILLDSLKQALRSDYEFHINGETWAERCWALNALTDAGYADASYAAELSRKSMYLRLENKAQALLSLTRSQNNSGGLMQTLEDALWQGIVFRLHHGREVYGGLAETNAGSPIILPSESRTLSQVIRSLSVVSGPKQQDKLKILVDGLINLGQGDGWGSTKANAAAMFSLSQYLKNKPSTSPVIIMTGNGEKENIKLQKGLHHLNTEHTKEIQLTTKSNTDLTVQTQTFYIPTPLGSQAQSVANGFVVTRIMLNHAEQKFRLDQSGQVIEFKTGEIIEEHLEVVNPDNRHFVAVMIPLAAGMEPLNPNLATASTQAVPQGRLTLAPTYQGFYDDQMVYYYNNLPKGTYHFYFRTRALTPGTYSQPPAQVEMMYNQRINGSSNGAQIKITKEHDEHP